MQKKKITCSRFNNNPHSFNNVITINCFYRKQERSNISHKNALKIKKWRAEVVDGDRNDPPRRRLHVKYFGFVAFGNDVVCVCVCVCVRLCLSCTSECATAPLWQRWEGFRVQEGRMIIGLQPIGRGSRELRPLRAGHTHDTPTDRRWGFGMTAQHSRRIWALYSKYTPLREKHTQTHSYRPSDASDIIKQMLNNTDYMTITNCTSLSYEHQLEIVTTTKYNVETLILCKAITICIMKSAILINLNWII